MDLEYLKWCNERLTGTEFATYAVLAAIGPAVITQAEVADYTGKSAQRVNDHMQALQRKKFICYQGLGWAGCDIYWVRSSADENPPKSDSPLITQYRWKLVNEKTGEKAKLRAQEVAEWARSRRLRPESVRNVLNGVWQQYKGWTIAK